MFLDFFENVLFEWFQSSWGIFTYSIGIILIVIWNIWLLVKINKKIKLFGIINILFVILIWIVCFFGFGIGWTVKNSVNDLDYSYSYSNDFDAQEIKRMDYDIYLKENGDIHVKQVIQMFNYNNHRYRIEFSERSNWLISGGEISDARNLKITDITAR